MAAPFGRLQPALFFLMAVVAADCSPGYPHFEELTPAATADEHVISIMQPDRSDGINVRLSGSWHWEGSTVVIDLGGVVSVRGTAPQASIGAIIIQEVPGSDAQLVGQGPMIPVVVNQSRSLPLATSLRLFVPLTEPVTVAGRRLVILLHVMGIDRTEGTLTMCAGPNGLDGNPIPACR
jgi:hypothetical protein